ncbi:MAG: hypothetical protein WC711_03685 [Candidatus Staskawiczbacteria bacterium]|jgi:hypothetical protein
MDIIDKLINKLVGRHGLFLLVIFASISMLLVSWIEFLVKFYLGSYIPNIQDVLRGALLLVFWLFLIKICQWLWEKTIFFFKLIKRFILGNRIISVPEVSEWIFQGSLNVIGDSLELTTSNSGCLIKNFLYKNFSLNCVMKIPNGGRGSLIFRAKDLENYLMIQFELADTSDNGTIVYDIVPHIRYMGHFETFKIYQPVYPNERHFPTLVKYDKIGGLPVNLKVQNSVVKLTIGIERKEFYWNIPTHTEQNILSNMISGQQEAQQNKIESLTGRIDPLDGILVPRIWFRGGYGRIGFRAWGLEKIIISDLKIEPI